MHLNIAIEISLCYTSVIIVWLSAEQHTWSSDVLKHGNYKLAMLYHSNNRLIYVGAAHLIDALKHGNCKLAVLYLSDNRLTDSRAAHLRGALI